MVRRVTSREARATFSELLGRVHYTQEPTIVEKNGKPFAVVISPEQFERLQEAQQAAWALVDRVQARNADFDPDEVLADVTAEVEAVREARHRSVG
jgi:prevent-host-death family protein